MSEGDSKPIAAPRGTAGRATAANSAATDTTTTEVDASSSNPTMEYIQKNLASSAHSPSTSGANESSSLWKEVQGKDDPSGERYWIVGGGRKVGDGVPVSWDRLRFMRLRRLILDETQLCRSQDGEASEADRLTFAQLFTLKEAEAAQASTVGREMQLRRQFQALGETLLIRPVGYPNNTACPLEFLTCNKEVAWEIPGVKVPRIGCKNYWVAGRAGGSSEWSEDDDGF